MDVLERIEKDGLRVSVSYGVMEEFDWKEDERLSNELLELAKIGQQSQHKERVLREALERLVGMCESIGNFSNGATYQGMDEGDVLAGRLIEDCREALEASK